MTRLIYNSLETPTLPLRILLLSPFGRGKTYIVGYISNRLKQLRGKKLKDFDFDLGTQTLKSNSFDVDVISYLINPEKMGETFDEFDEDFHTYLSDPQQYGGFAIDSLTTLQACAMDYVFKENHINRRRVGKTELANENDYGALVTLMTQVFPQILQISAHSIFIMTAHTRLHEDKLSGETKIMPAISGRSLPSQIGGWFNECWYLNVEGYRGDVKRLVQTASGGQVDCKTQIAGMPFEVPVIAAVEKALIAYGVNQNPSEETLQMIEEAFKAA